MIFLVALIGLAMWLLGFFSLSDGNGWDAVGLGLMLTGAIFMGSALVVAGFRGALESRDRRRDTVPAEED